MSKEDEKGAVNGVRGGECTVASLVDGMWEASSGAAGKTPVFHPLRQHSTVHSVVRERRSS